MAWRTLVVVVVVGACSNAKQESPASAEAKADPWAGQPVAESQADPWAKSPSTTPTPTPPPTTPPPTTPPPPPASPAASDGLPAGTYACQQMNFTANSPPTYTVTGISFVLDGKGGYQAPHFDGGPGTIVRDGNVLTFTGGAMNGWRGYLGTTGSGTFVRIRLKDPTAVATTLTRGDGMCYLQRQ